MRKVDFGKMLDNNYPFHLLVHTYLGEELLRRSRFWAKWYGILCYLMWIPIIGKWMNTQFQETNSIQTIVNRYGWLYQKEIEADKKQVVNNNKWKFKNFILI